MKNQISARNKKTVGWVLTAVFLSPMLAHAESCPLAKEAIDHAIKEGIGAEWQTGKSQWYLDYFSNNNKPPETVRNTFTFMQASFENQQLTCYYQWPSEDGRTNNWMTVRLRTTDPIKVNWNGKVCQNFEAVNCQFSFGNNAAGSIQQAAPAAATPAATTPAPSTTEPKPGQSSLPAFPGSGAGQPGGAIPPVGAPAPKP